MALLPGDDGQRLTSLHRALASEADVVLFARGGYGLSRLLDRIDWSDVAASRKVFCGYSDVTAFLSPRWRVRTMSPSPGR